MQFCWQVVISCVISIVKEIQNKQVLNVALIACARMWHVQKAKQEITKNSCDTYCRGATELVAVCKEFIQNHAKTPDVWRYWELTLSKRLWRIPVTNTSFTHFHMTDFSKSFCWTSKSFVFQRCMKVIQVFYSNKQNETYQNIGLSPGSLTL